MIRKPARSASEDEFLLAGAAGWHEKATQTESLSIAVFHLITFFAAPGRLVVVGLAPPFGRGPQVFFFHHGQVSCAEGKEQI